MDRAVQQPDKLVPRPTQPEVAGLEPELARLQGYRVVDLELGQGASPVGRRIGDLDWPASSMLIAVCREATAIAVSEEPGCTMVTG